MKTGHPITDVANAMNHARLIGLPPIKYERDQRPDGISFSDYKVQLRAGMLPKVVEERRPADEDLDVFMFPQVWGSTALGFGGMGGSSPRQANTVVVMCRKVQAAAIYFAGEHAYTVDLKDSNVHKQLHDDIRDRRVPSRSEATQRYASHQAGALPTSPGASP